MPASRGRRQPILEMLETRLAMSAYHGARPALMASGHSKVAAAVSTATAGDTLTVLNGFAGAYLSVLGDRRYNPAYDLNHNRQIGQTDGRILLHSLPPLSPRIPISLQVTLAPQDKVRSHVPSNLGGITYSKHPTVVGHTTPGALIFTGTGTLDLKLRGPAYVANAHGNFSFQVDMTDGINQLDLQAVNAHGRQTLRAFPILWLGFAKYESQHPMNK